MPIQLVNIGTLPNDGEGDPLRTAFQKINNNFNFIQQAATNITSAVTIGDTANQVIFSYPADEFTQALIQIHSYRDDTSDNQNALIGAAISNDGSNVSFVTYGITNTGDWLVNYDMNVTSGNVRLLISPLGDYTINHFMAYQVTYVGDLGAAVPMVTESDETIITEYGTIPIGTES